MNEDDDKTVIQTEEDRKKLEKRLLKEQSEDVTPVAYSEDDEPRKPA